MSLKIATLSRAMPLDRAMPPEARFVHSEVTVYGQHIRTAGVVVSRGRTVEDARRDVKIYTRAL
eukprot:scaffold69702_cov69-Phaeocystis_antarctica.AAC.1